uniref:MAM domain-containing protein, meprin/A5/mu n=2 Tax=Candidatus Kentrum sp. TUN TaxID=2126343 RepID=A0A451B0A5_9GAMM|nr:MAG: MAM domain-containing protein, meprin/A5/mu [Candidatus Kentron sp. TUN]
MGHLLLYCRPLFANFTFSIYRTTILTQGGGWTAVEDTSIFDWTRRTGGTPSGYTGPSGAHEGEYYLYLETSYGNTPGKIAYLESPDFSGEAVSGMTFHYHLYGQQMGTLTVDTPSTVGTLNATAYTDTNLLSVQTGAEEEVLVVDRTGNVGIGTAAPKAKLDVAGGIRIGNETICDAGKAGTIRYDNTGREVEFCNGTAWTRVEGPEGPQGLKGDKGDLGDSFWSQSGTNISYNDGNVGVGTTSPAEAIEIKDNKPVLSLHEPNVATFKVGSDGGVFKIAAMDNGYGGYTSNFNANDAQLPLRLLRSCA